jgi:hypothetical protein
LGLVVLAVLTVSPCTCLAGELSGKLERVDRATVTLVDLSNRRIKLRVDVRDRCKAAAYLGKSVKVQVRPDGGHPRAVLFSSCR